MRDPRKQCIAVLMLFGLLIPGSAPIAFAEGNGTIVGVARFDGPKPRRARLAMIEKGGKPSHCRHLHKEPLLDENILISDKGAIKNVFVYIKKGAPRKDYPLPKKPAILNQVKCMFQPRVQGVRVGQEFVMKNGDPLLHNVRSYSFRNRAFNIAQPANSPDRKKVFRAKERAIMIQCDIHPWMKAYYFVMDHPFFAVTDDNGKFSIQGLPPGDYTLSAWHEVYKEQSTKIKVGSGTIEANFTFKQQKQD